jgi:hypothetical protein
MVATRRTVRATLCGVALVRCMTRAMNGSMFA